MIIKNAYLMANIRGKMHRYINVSHLVYYTMYTRSDVYPILSVLHNVYPIFSVLHNVYPKVTRGLI